MIIVLILFGLTILGVCLFQQKKRFHLPETIPGSTQKKDNRWLSQSTSTSNDPKAGAIFTSIFLKGESEKTLNFSNHPEAGSLPNLIYALIETIKLEGELVLPIKEAMEKAISANWHLAVSWNSPKTVITADKHSLAPKIINFFLDKRQAYLLLVLDKNNGEQVGILIPLSNNQHSQKIIEIVEGIISHPGVNEKEKETEGKIINFNLCSENSNYQEYVGFGSTKLMIMSQSSNACEIEITNEVEEGTPVVYHCRVPKSLGKISLPITNYGTDFSLIKKYCQ